MFKDLLKEHFLIRILLILLIIAISAHLFTVFWQVTNVFSDIIGIIVIAWLLSFMLEPLTDKISAVTTLSKVASAAITYLLLFAGFVIIAVIFFPLVNNQIQSLSKTLPHFLASSPPFISKWSQSLTNSLEGSVVFLPSVAQFLIYTIIVLVISFYLIIDKDHINKQFYALTPVVYHTRLRFVQKVIGNTFGSFLHIQLIIALLTGIVTWVVLQAVGIQYAVAIAVLAGILGTLPLVGPILAAIPPVFFTFIIDPWLAVIVLLVLTIIQQIIFNVFVPRAFGKALKVHPVIILLASIAGYKLGGAIGAIFAIPLAGISAVMVKEIWEYFETNGDK